MSPHIGRVCRSDSWREKPQTQAFVVFEPAVAKEKTERPVLFVPDGFEPERYLAPERQHLADRACYLLHTIHTQMIFNHRDRGNGVHLMAAYLRKFMTKRHYVGIIADLESGGVIKVTRKARDGQSFAYQLAGRFRTQVFRRYCPQDPRLVRQLEDWRAEQDRELQCPVRNHLKRQLESVTIEFDDARSCLRGLNLTDEGLASCLNCLVRLDDRGWYFVSDKFGRVHHNITCLKRELRQFLRVDGQKLVELDISNSQPLFCGLTFMNWTNNNESLSLIHSDNSLSNVLCLKQENIHELISLRKQIQLSRQSTTEHKSNNTPLLCPLRDNVNNDSLKYLLLCEQGKFYEYLADKADVDVSETDNRTEFKKQVFKHLFYAKWRDKDNRIVKTFRQEFPSIYSMIESVNYKDKARLAQWMQRVESAFVIDRVVKRFMDEKPNAFVMTIHDSILVKQDDAEFAKEVFQKSFRRVGLEPTLNSK